jgi:hypothetical protein
MMDVVRDILSCPKTIGEKGATKIMDFFESDTTLGIICLTCEWLRVGFRIVLDQIMGMVYKYPNKFIIIHRPQEAIDCLSH